MISRPKNRYVLVEATVPLDTENKAVSHKIIALLCAEVGALGYVRGHPTIVRRLGDRSFIIRINRGYEGDVALAFSFVKDMDGSPVGFFTLRTSGSMKKLVGIYKRAGP
ncbi:MAG: Rpp14/Pop5 family protein [Candidatus Micrarchaeaceae archaeon]